MLFSDVSVRTLVVADLRVQFFFLDAAILKGRACSGMSVPLLKGLNLFLAYILHKYACSVKGTICFI